MSEPVLDVAWEVIYLYLLESHAGRLTRGLASIQLDLLTVQTGLKLADLKKTLRTMQAQHLIIIHQVDDVAVDLAVTAVGLGQYVSRSKP